MIRFFPHPGCTPAHIAESQTGCRLPHEGYGSERQAMTLDEYRRREQEADR